jgi:hypothetical protein
MKQRPTLPQFSQKREDAIELIERRYAYTIMHDRLSMYMSSQDYVNRRDIIREALSLKEPLENEGNKDEFRTIESERPFDYTSKFLQEKKSDLYNHIHKMFEHVFFMFGYLGNMMIAQDVLYGDAFVLPDFSRVTTEQIGLQILSNRDDFLKLDSITQKEINAFEIEYRKLGTTDPVFQFALEDFYKQLEMAEVKPTRMLHSTIDSSELDALINYHGKNDADLGMEHSDESVEYTYQNIANMNTDGKLDTTAKRKRGTQYKVFLKRYKDQFNGGVAKFLKKHFRIPPQT